MGAPGIVPAVTIQLNILEPHTNHLKVIIARLIMNLHLAKKAKLMLY